MTVLDIVQVGHPVLRQRAQEVEDVADVQTLIDDLIETMRTANGAGLAANQVGDLRRVAVAEVRPDHPRYPYKPELPLTVLINPVVERIDDEVMLVNEGCLSVPALRGDVERAVTVRVRYLDRHGAQQEQVVRGLSAGTFQHEVDHLDGVLFLDRADPRSLATWEEWERSGKAAFLERIKDLPS